MLKIRPEQQNVFDPVAEAAFERRLVKYLRKHHAAAVVRLSSGSARVEALREETLAEMVRGGIARARRYGIRWESNLNAFVVLMFVAAPNFDRHPLIRRVLTDKEVAAEERLDRLWEATTEENWLAVDGAYDADAWGLSPVEPEAREGV